VVRFPIKVIEPIFPSSLPDNEIEIIRLPLFHPSPSFNALVERLKRLYTPKLGCGFATKILPQEKRRMR
jgi:hypothetical protein